MVFSCSILIAFLSLFHHVANGVYVSTKMDRVSSDTLDQTSIHDSKAENIRNDNKLISNEVYLEMQHSQSKSDKIRLPTELMMNIMENIDNLEDLRNCHLVCKGFETLLPLDLSPYFSPQGFLLHVYEKKIKPSPVVNKLVKEMNLEGCSVQRKLLIRILIWNGWVDKLEVELIRANEKGYFENFVLWINDALFDITKMIDLAENPNDLSALEKSLCWISNKLNCHDPSLLIPLLEVAARFNMLHTILNVDGSQFNSIEEFAIFYPSRILRTKLNLTKFSPAYHGFIYDDYKKLFIEQEEFYELVGACLDCTWENVTRIIENTHSPSNIQRAFFEILRKTFVTGNVQMFKMVKSRILPPLPPECLKKSLLEAIRRGHSDLVDHILDGYPAESRWKLLSNYEWEDWSHDFLSLNVLNEIVLQTSIDSFSTHDKKILLDVYSRNMCGNGNDFMAFKKLSSDPGFVYNDTLLSHVLAPQPFRDSLLVVRGHCKRTFMINIIHDMVERLGIIPTEHHLKLSLRWGQFDIFKFLYEGFRSSSNFAVFNPQWFKELPSNHDISLQEPLLLDYMMNELLTLKYPAYNQLKTPLQKFWAKRSLLMMFKKISKWNKSNYMLFDCYNSRIINRFKKYCIL